jgi:hypothetical protein
MSNKSIDYSVNSVERVARSTSGSHQTMHTVPTHGSTPPQPSPSNDTPKGLGDDMLNQQRTAWTDEKERMYVHNLLEICAMV